MPRARMPLKEETDRQAEGLRLQQEEGNRRESGVKDQSIKKH